MDILNCLNNEYAVSFIEGCAIFHALLPVSEIPNEGGRSNVGACVYTYNERYRDVTREPEGEDLVYAGPELAPVAMREQNGREGALQAELVARSLAGDEAAFAAITEQYGALLLRTAYFLVKDEEAAKDIVQESLLLAWRNLDKLREPTYLRAWLLKIVVNQAMSLKRQLARKAALLRMQLLQQEVDTTIQSAEFQRGRVEDTLDVMQAIGQLPMNQRVVLILFYYHRMTMPEIATMLSVNENTLRKRLQAALQKVRRVLQIEEQEGSVQNGLDGRVSINRGNVR